MASVTMGTGTCLVSQKKTSQPSNMSPWPPAVASALLHANDIQSSWTAVCKLLHSVFPATASLTVQPTAVHYGRDDDCVWPGLEFTILSPRGPVLWITVDGRAALENASSRKTVYRRLIHKRLGNHLSADEQPFSFVRGISFFGVKYAVFTVDIASRCISPTCPSSDPNHVDRGVPPLEWWEDASEKEGGSRLRTILEEYLPDATVGAVVETTARVTERVRVDKIADLWTHASARGLLFMGECVVVDVLLQRLLRMGGCFREIGALIFTEDAEKALFNVTFPVVVHPLPMEEEPEDDGPSLALSSLY